ncbi:MAG: ATP-grasp family protein, partial [Thermodesulfobacteriota bacterium]
MPKIGVVGTIGGWSSEMLADKVAEKTGYRLLIDPKKICLDLGAKTVRYKDTDLAGLDALMIKKVGARYSPDLLDRLEMLRFLQERGLRMFSNPFAIMRVLDRLSCTVTLAGGGIPMPPTTVTEDVDAALKAVADYNKAVFKPLFSSKARGMKVIPDGPNARREVADFKQENEIMYIQKMMDLGGQDLGV